MNKLLSDQAIWIRGGTCEFARGAFHCLGKTPIDSAPYSKSSKSYNLFDYFYPGGKGPSGERSLYLEFAQLSDDPQAIRLFLEEYGPLHLKNTLNPKEQLPFDTPDLLKDIVSVKQTFRTVLILCQASHDNRPDLVRDWQDMKLYVPQNGQLRSIRPAYTVEDVRARLGVVLFHYLSAIPNCPFWDKESQEWKTKWMIPSLLSGLYLLLFRDLQDHAIHRRCPINDYGCGNFFVTTRQRAIYCSERCQKRAKVKRMRDPLAKKKARPASPGK